ncbi:hypothetical protein Tco_0053950 [Tanacetum coccineum]
MRGCVVNKSLLGIFHAILSVVCTTTNLASRSDFVHLNGLFRSKMSFHQALDLIFKLDETTHPGFFGVSVTKLTSGQLVDSSSRNGIDMGIKDLDLEPKIDAMMREFLDPSRWNKLSKEMSSKILLADDQAIQTILMGLPEDIYTVVDSCKKGKLFNEWEMFTSTDGESIESYYHQWSRHVTIVHQTKDLHTPDYTQLYDFLKYNQKEVDELRAKRLARTHDPLALMANSNNPFNYSVFHQDQSSPNPTTTMNMTLVLMAKAFKLNYSTPTNNNQRISSNPHNRQIAQPGMNLGQDRQMQMVGGNGGNQFRHYAGQNGGNQNGFILVLGIVNKNGNGNVIAAHAEVDLDEIKVVYVNCILMANLQQASISGTQTDNAPVYDSDGSAENDSNVISEVSIMKQSEGTVEQHPATVEETHAYFESLYSNLAIEVEKVNTVNRKLRETNADLTTKLARYKNQEKCFEISQEKYDKLERKLQMLSKEKSIVSSLLEEKKKFKSDFKICKDELLDKQRKLPSSSRPKLYSVTPFPKSKGLPKIDESHALSKPVTSNSVPTPQELKVMKNDKVISPRMFRINPFKTSREEKHVSNKPTKESGRTKPITASQPHVNTKKDVNSNSNGFSSTGVNITAKTRRPQPRSNTKC